MLKNHRRPIALVYIAIDDRGPLQATLALQHPHCDGHVMEDGKALAVIGKGVMRPAGQIGRQPVPHGQAAGYQRALHGQAGAPNQRGRPREPEHTHLARRHVAGQKTLHVIAMMHQQQ